MTIRAPEDVHAGAGLDPERRRLLQQALAPASRRARNLDVRWAVVEYPTAAAAEQAGMTLGEYADFVYDACLLDWDAEEERMREIKDRFDGGRSVHIQGEGTDLTIGIEGREGVVSAGFRNMPDGEVFFSPVEDSAEGVISYGEFPAIYLGHDVVGARLVFRGGRSRRGERRGGRGVPQAGARDRRRLTPPGRARVSAAIRGSPASRATSSSTRRSMARSTSPWARATPTRAERTRAPCTGTWSRTCAPAAS